MRGLGGPSIIAVHKNCPEGQVFSPASKVCQVNAEIAAFASYVTKPDCQKDELYDPDTNSCQPIKTEGECKGKQLNQVFADPKNPS